MAQIQAQSLLPFAAEDLLDPAQAAQAELLRLGPGMEAGLWDEMRHADGRLRDNWREFARWLSPLQSGSLAAFRMHCPGPGTEWR